MWQAIAAGVPHRGLIVAHCREHLACRARRRHVVGQHAVQPAGLAAVPELHPQRFAWPWQLQAALALRACTQRSRHDAGDITASPADLCCSFARRTHAWLRLLVRITATGLGTSAQARWHAAPRARTSEVRQEWPGLFRLEFGLVLCCCIKRRPHDWGDAASRHELGQLLGPQLSLTGGALRKPGQLGARLSASGSRAALNRKLGVVHLGGGGVYVSQKRSEVNFGWLWLQGRTARLRLNREPGVDRTVCRAPLHAHGALETVGSQMRSASMSRGANRWGNGLHCTAEGTLKGSRPTSARPPRSASTPGAASFQPCSRAYVESAVKRSPGAASLVGRVAASTGWPG